MCIWYYPTAPKTIEQSKRGSDQRSYRSAFTKSFLSEEFNGQRVKAQNKNITTYSKIKS